MTFAQALKKLPLCIGGYDPLSHKTIADLAFLVQHEIDLYEEGEESDIVNQMQLNLCKRYLRRISP